MRQCKHYEIIFFMADVNAKIREGQQIQMVVPFGLGERNERRERFFELCSERGQVIVNTYFTEHLRRLWTSKSPGEQFKNQTDYVTINK